MAKKSVRPNRLNVAFRWYFSYAFCLHFTVRRIIGFGLNRAKMPKDEIARSVDATAATLKF